MKRSLFILSLLSFFVFSCRKDESTGKGEGNIIMHTAYVSALVIDSATGLPAPGTTVYASNGCFASGLYTGSGTFVADASGRFTNVRSWVTGTSGGSGVYYPTPATSERYYLTAHSTSGIYGYRIFTHGDLIENDTLFLPDIYLKPCGYISTHIKDQLPVVSSVFSITTTWQSTLNGFESRACSPGVDTVIIKPVCADFKVYIFAGPGSLYYDSVMVGSGDTAFVDVFY